MDAALIESSVIELRTFRDMVRWGVSQFMAAKLCYGHGTDNPWDEAAWLALNCLHLAPTDIEKIADAFRRTRYPFYGKNFFFVVFANENLLLI